MLLATCGDGELSLRLVWLDLCAINSEKSYRKTTTTTNCKATGAGVNINNSNDATAAAEAMQRQTNSKINIITTKTTMEEILNECGSFSRVS